MRATTCSALFLGVLLGAGCSSATSLEPVYDACASDENWRTFDDYETTGRVENDPSNDPMWLMPMMNAVVPSAMPAIIQWQPTMTDPGMMYGDAVCPQFQPGSISGLSATPLHLPPVSGTVYDLHFAMNGTDVYRVVTTQQQEAAPIASWSGWAGKTLTLTLYKAQMLMNEVVTGPYQSSPLTLQISQ
jgi:hypothetical protein